MRFKVSNNIEVEEPDMRALERLLESLVLPNPDYYKKQQMGKWLGNTPATICLYEKVGDRLRLPFGCLQRLWEMFPDMKRWELGFSPISVFSYYSHIKLYSYQEKAKNEALGRKNGILLMPCGSGKTQTGLEIIARLGMRALWLTHTHDLLRQSKKRAQDVFDCGPAAFGEISGGKVNIGEGITFATVQTMAKLDLVQYRDVWDIVIVDECQHCAGSPTKVTQFYKVVSNLNARYKIGLTATLHRADGLERAVTALLGGVMYEVTREDVGERTCPIVVEDVETGYVPDFDAITMPDGTIDYMALIDDLTTNENRLQIVTGSIESKIGKGPMLVLANRVAYLEELHKRYRGESVCISGGGQSKKAKQERKEALEKLNEYELSCVFATYQLAAEGLDVPNLRYVVFATPEKNKTTVTQAAGRVCRKAPGKNHGTVIDFVDNFPMYKGWAAKRKRFYEKLGG